MPGQVWSSPDATSNATRASCHGGTCCHLLGSSSPGCLGRGVVADATAGAGAGAWLGSREALESRFGGSQEDGGLQHRSTGLSPC